jgi:hypothetical protein
MRPLDLLPERVEAETFETRGPWVRVSKGTLYSSAQWVHAGLVTGLEYMSDCGCGPELVVYVAGKNGPVWCYPPEQAALMSAIDRAQQFCVQPPLMQQQDTR